MIKNTSELLPLCTTEIKRLMTHEFVRIKDRKEVARRFWSGKVPLSQAHDACMLHLFAYVMCGKGVSVCLNMFTAFAFICHPNGSQLPPVN
jgi:hypothetical protein